MGVEFEKEKVIASVERRVVVTFMTFEEAFTEVMRITEEIVVKSEEVIRTTKEPKTHQIDD